MTTATKQSRAAALSTALQWTGLLAILSIAALRMVTSFNHVIVFDVDPALDPNPYAGLASESLWLDVLLLGGAGLALLGHWLQHRVLSWWYTLAALLPMFVVFVHGFDDLGDMRTGATWSAAAVAGVTIAHLGRSNAMRIIVIMVVAGVLGPLLVRGAANVTYEYEDTLALYEQQKQLVLADKGWSEGSSSAKIYQRRLEQRQPTAWFSTTNIFGTFMAAGLVLWIGLAVAAVRARLASGWTGLCVIFAVLCAAGLWMTGSNGALLACLAGLGSLVVLLIAALRRDALSHRAIRLAPVLAVGLVAGALAGIVIRGAILPESFVGEVSLLYRWHYIVAALRMFGEHWMLGVGPDEFQAQYMIHRVAHNPEEVTSAHSMFFDWLATLGIVGIAWTALVVALLWKAGRSCTQAKDVEQHSKAMSLTPVIAVGVTLVVAVFGIALAMLWERHILDALSATVRGIGVISFAILALVAGHIAARADRRVLDITLLAAAIVLLVHGQIEMTWTRPGSVVMAWVMLGVAAPITARSERYVGVSFVAVLLAAAGWLAVTSAAPAMRLQGQMVDAARQLRPAAEVRQMQLVLLSKWRGGSQQRIEILNRRDAALAELDIHAPAQDLTWPELEALLKPALVKRRIAAADILEPAYRDWPVSEDALAMASRQLGRASENMHLPQRLDVLQRSIDLAEESAAAHNDIASASLAIGSRLKMYELTGRREHVDMAIELATWLTERDPKGVRAFVTLGDVLWQNEQHERAAAAYRTAMQHSDNFKLDPLKQLEADTREQIESRLQELNEGE